MGKEIYRDGDFYLILRGGTYQVHGYNVAGRRIRVSCGTRELQEAKIFLENMKREYVGGWREDYDRADRSWKDVAKLIYDRQKPMAFKRGLPFELEPSDIYALMKSTGFRCAISGIPFAKRLIKDGKRDPWAASIDRIENRHGYSVENCRVVCVAANIALADWGIDVLLRLSRGILKSSLVLSDELTPDRHRDEENQDKTLIRLVKSE